MTLRVQNERRNTFVFCIDYIDKNRQCMSPELFLHCFSSPKSINIKLELSAYLPFRKYIVFNTLPSRHKKLPLRTVLVVYLSVPFLLKSSYTLLRMLKCLKLYAWNCIWGQDTPDFMEISSYPRNCIIFIIKVINYALSHTFESKRYMYFHNKTWYTCTHCYM